MAKISAFTLRQSALETLTLGLSRDKSDRHEFIVSHVATIVALALAKQAPKGFGNPADHAKLAPMFAAAKLERYSEHSCAIAQALKGRMRSLDWTDAQQAGDEIAIAAYAELAPKSRTAEELAASATKKAAKKAETEKQAKADAKAEKQARADELAHEFMRGQQSAVVTGAMVADAIKAGAFSAADLAIIGAALAVRTAKRPTAPADVTDVPSRAVLSLPAAPAAPAAPALPAVTA